MTLTELQDQWAIDCVIDENNLGHAAATSPSLHSFYINETIAMKLKLTKCQLEIAAMRAIKGRYFRGELTSAELAERGWEQWQYRTLKADISDMTDADKDVQILIAREQYVKTIIYMLESILGEIKSRSFSIRASLDWAKFRAGG
jgi:hypothetical protein